MNDLLSELHHNIFTITFDKAHIHNAFDDVMLGALQKMLDEAIADPQVLIIILRANGKSFSAGADLSWMQRMAYYSEEENINDAMILARLMETLYRCPKPTIAVVQGAVLGGGVGLVAACDIAVAAKSTRFSFSEVRIGLIPAVISPYIVRAIGERLAKWLFMTAEIFSGEQALHYNLVQHCVENESELWPFAHNYATKITQFGPKAIIAAKALVHNVSERLIDDELIKETATLIAKVRSSKEGQTGLHAFLSKEDPKWE